jgi:hypothetical protein
MTAAAILTLSGAIGTYVSYRENAPRIAMLWAFSTGLCLGFLAALAKGVAP